MLAEGTPPLQQVNLNYNCIGDGGAAALAFALRHNGTLRFLWLNHNGVGEAGAAALAQALVSNTALQTMDLGRNEFDANGPAAALFRTTQCSVDCVGNFCSEAPESPLSSFKERPHPLGSRS